MFIVGLQLCVILYHDNENLKFRMGHGPPIKVLHFGAIVNGQQKIIRGKVFLVRKYLIPYPKQSRLNTSTFDYGFNKCYDIKRISKEM